LPCVTEVDGVDGPYDIIVMLSDNNMDMIKESIRKHMTRIHHLAVLSPYVKPKCSEVAENAIWSLLLLLLLLAETT
jgi:hypothetical protein